MTVNLLDHTIRHNGGRRKSLRKDPDIILTREERRLLNESVIHEQLGMLVSLREPINVRRKTR